MNNWQAIKFGTDGWRAIIAEDFTFGNVALAVAAISQYVLEEYGTDKPVLVSYDPRFLADKFALHAVSVLRSFELSALLVDRDTPTPVIAHAAKDLDSAGAIQFTASHNPAEYCGIKYIPDYAGPANESITQRIKEFVNELGQAGYTFEREEHPPAAEIFSPKAAYIEAIQELIDFDALGKSNLKIGVDSLNGAGRGYLNELLDCKVVLGQERDPLFRGSLPEPTNETLKELIIQIKKQGLDIGLSNDGDADRFAIIDETGSLYSPNQILSILAKYLVEYKGLGKNQEKRLSIVRTVATTHLLDRIADKLGLDLVETPVGFKYIAEEMRKGSVLIGGEESGGLSIFGHIPEKDGILACLLVCEAMIITKKTLPVLWQEVLDFAGYKPFNKRLDLHLSNEKKERVIARLKNETLKEIKGLSVVETIRKDGIKLILSDGSWTLIRASGTEPLLRIYLEASSETALAELEESMSDLVESLGQPLEEAVVC